MSGFGVVVVEEGSGFEWRRKEENGKKDGKEFWMRAVASSRNFGTRRP